MDFLRELQTFKKEQIAAFKDNPVWTEIVEATKERIESIRDELERGYIVVKGFGLDGSIEEQRLILNYEELRARQAEALSLRYLLTIPELLTTE